MMAKSYLIYLDVCCLNRPFDDWTQERIRLEGQTILDIFKRFYLNQWKLISSEVIEAELKRMTNLYKLNQIRELLKIAESKIILNDEIDQRSQEIENLGLTLFDSFHIACAEYARVDILLTTDDRLLRKAIKYSNLGSPVPVVISTAYLNKQANNFSLMNLKLLNP
ncbi:PIN domain-containing protein [Gloeothece citriformis]|nr:PIN domain-containing protein [Gloeothece citriformis]